MSTIKVTRNGETRVFSLTTWEKLPADKYGWKPAADVPNEVKEIQEHNTFSNEQKGTVIPFVPNHNEVPAADTPNEVKEEEVEQVNNDLPQGITEENKIEKPKRGRKNAGTKK